MITAKKRIETLLNKLHSTAADGNLKEYISCYSHKAVFVGTDSSEYWNMRAFYLLCRRAFRNGRGWTYTVKRRVITTSKCGKHAWFYEELDNEKYVHARGSGVVQLMNRRWVVMQYIISFPVPNILAKSLANQVKKLRKKKK